MFLSRHYWPTVAQNKSWSQAPIKRFRKFSFCLSFPIKIYRSFNKDPGGQWTVHLSWLATYNNTNYKVHIFRIFNYRAIVHFDEKFREFIVSNQNLWMSILNYLDNFAVIIKPFKLSAKNIVFQEILKNCLP